MFKILWLVALVLCYTEAAPQLDVCMANTIPDMITGEERLGRYPRFIEFPDGEGNMHTVDLEAQPDPEAFNDVRNAANNRYWLYTRRNSLLHQELQPTASSVQNSNFDISKEVHFICHGWLSTGLTEPNPTIRRALLGERDVNIITVDWRELASSDYATAVAGVPSVGRAVGQFCIMLNNMGVPWSNMHLTGFSLGGHVIGNAGRETGGRVARITSLDPAGPLWNLNTNRVRASDAVYVEAIHTDGSLTGLGIGSAVANADFFPNGGSSMPGCSTSLCNHNRAWELFASSITNRHLFGTGCTSMTQVSLNTCRGNRFELGNSFLNKFGTGIYRLNPGSSYPF